MLDKSDINKAKQGIPSDAEEIVIYEDEETGELFFVDDDGNERGVRESKGNAPNDDLLPDSLPWKYSSGSGRNLPSPTSKDERRAEQLARLVAIIAKLGSSEACRALVAGSPVTWPIGDGNFVLFCPFLLFFFLLLL